MKNYYVYILPCSDGSYYTGVTNNLSRRVDEHENGNNTNAYTFNKRPLKLVYHAVFNDIVHAISSEKQIKKWSRKKKEALINGDWIQLKRLARNQSQFTTEEF